MIENILCYAGAFALGFISCVAILVASVYISDRKLEKEINSRYDSLN